MFTRKSKVLVYLIPAVSILCFMLILYLLIRSKSPGLLGWKWMVVDYGTISGVFDTLFTLLNIVLFFLFGLCLFMGRGILQWGTVLLLIISYVLLNGITYSAVLSS